MRTRIIDRAVNDAQFRKALLADPNAAVADELGVESPGSLSIHVHEESPGDAHLVLPPSGGLDEGDLENVTGGDAWKFFFPSTWQA